VSRWGAQRPQGFSFAAKIAGAAARPIATQGRSYKGQERLQARYSKRPGDGLQRNPGGSRCNPGRPAAAQLKHLGQALHRLL